jgi:hypothetical protein
MRTYTLLPLLAAMALSASAMAAPAAVTPDAAGVMAVQTIAGSAYKLRPAEFEGVQGSYGLSNGQTLRVWSAHRKLYADVGQTTAELVPVASNVFVSRNEDIKLVFDQVPFATEVALTTMAAK